MTAVLPPDASLAGSLCDCSNGSGDGLHGNWRQRGVQEWHGIRASIAPSPLDPDLRSSAQLTATLDPRAAPRDAQGCEINAAGSR